MPDLPAEPAGEDLLAPVAAPRAANARLREVVEAKDAQLAAAEAALKARSRSSSGLPAAAGAPSTVSPTSRSSSPTCPPPPNGLTKLDALRKLFVTGPWLPPAVALP